MPDLAIAINKLLDSNKGTHLFVGFIFVGLIIKLVFGLYQPASAVIWGYFIIIFSIIGIIFLSVDTSKNDWDAVKQLIFQPLLLLILILLWNISLNFQYYKEINKRTIPNIYYTWSHFSTILIISIVILYVFNFIIESPLNMYSYILLILNVIVTGIQQVILDNFTVDG